MEDRRKVLKAAAAGSIGIMLPHAAYAQSKPKEARPQEGDRFVFGEGERKGSVVKLDELKPDAPPITVYPQEPKSGVVWEFAVK